MIRTVEAGHLQTSRSPDVESRSRNVALPRRWAAFLGTIWAQWLVPALASAGELSYVAPPECGDRNHFQRQVETECEAAMLSPLRLEVSRDSRGYHLTLAFEEPDKPGIVLEQRSHPTSCEALIELAALNTRQLCAEGALPEVPAEAAKAQEEEQGSSAASSSSPSGAKSPAKPRPDKMKSRDRAESSSSGGVDAYWVALGYAAQSGTTPKFDQGVAFLVGGRIGIHQLGIGGEGWFGNQVSVELGDGEQTTMSVQRTTLRLEDCLLTSGRDELLPWGVAIGACLSVGYAIAATEFPAGTQGVDYRSWATGGAALVGALKLDEAFLLEATAAIEANIAPPSVPAMPFDVVYQFGDFAGSAGLRVSWVFDSNPPAESSRTHLPRKNGSSGRAKSLNNWVTW